MNSGDASLRKCSKSCRRQLSMQTRSGQTILSRFLKISKEHLRQVFMYNFVLQTGVVKKCNGAFLKNWCHQPHHFFCFKIFENSIHKSLSVLITSTAKFNLEGCFAFISINASGNCALEHN